MVSTRFLLVRTDRILRLSFFTGSPGDSRMILDNRFHLLQYSLFLLFFSRTPLTYNRLLHFLTFVTIPAPYDVISEVQLSFPTVVRTATPPSDRTSRSWARVQQGQGEKASCCSTIGSLTVKHSRPAGRYRVSRGQQEPLSPDRLLPSLLLLLPSRAARLLPCQLPCPGFHIGAFSSGS